MPATRFLSTILLAAILMSGGCRWAENKRALRGEIPVTPATDLEIEYPDVASEPIESSPEPWTVDSSPPREYWNLSLQEVVQIALARSSVLRDLGGTVVRFPDTAPTVFLPAIRETNPQLGVEAALSQFDADWSTRFFFERNDRQVNNRFQGDLGLVRQDLGLFESVISKPAVTGSIFRVSKVVEYGHDNQVANLFESGVWTTLLDAEARQPILQGAGIRFNRIAGPDSEPGVYNGVLVARTRTDMSLAEFEAAVRDFVSNVENTYWDLYFAYRDLDAKIAARDASLDTWRSIHALFAAGRKGGEAQNEAQAREQYFRFEEDVQNALDGRLVEGTRTNNGSGGGTFRGAPGVYLAERRLRMMMGLPQSDGRLIRPADEPVAAAAVFDWQQVALEAVTRRAELRRQKWLLKRRELELVAAKNFLLPRLDVVARYRWRGFGDELIDPDRDGKSRFDNAYMDLTSGDFAEWQMGFELDIPLGFRQAHTAHRNAEHQVAREQAVLQEQEREILHEAANAVADVARAHKVTQTSYNRRLAAGQQLEAMKAAYQDDITPEQLFLVLDAQRRLADASSNYYRSLVDYALALKNVHFSKGTLLEYNGVHLAEGPHADKAHIDAARRERLRMWPMHLNYKLSQPPIVGPPGPVEFVEPGPWHDPAAPLRPPPEELPIGPPVEEESEFEGAVRTDLRRLHGTNAPRSPLLDEQGWPIDAASPPNPPSGFPGEATSFKKSESFDKRFEHLPHAVMPGVEEEPTEMPFDQKFQDLPRAVMPQ